MRAVRTFLLAEAASFAIASAIHTGMLLTGYEHARARVAEGVIAVALFVGLLLTFVRPRWTRRAGIGAQAFALLGTCVGLFTVAIGVGPRTVPDVVYHIAIIVILIAGLRVAARVHT